jgi:hypothetical protein
LTSIRESDFSGKLGWKFGAWTLLQNAFSLKYFFSKATNFLEYFGHRMGTVKALGCGL